MAGILIFGISRVSTWEFQEKWHLGVALMTNRRTYYKGGRWWLSSWCFILFFGIAKNSYNGLIASYSCMGQPWYSKCRTPSNWATFLWFSPTTPFAN
jgi:hypothetical protein